MTRKNKKAAKPQKKSSQSASVHQSKQVICFDGENLVQLLKSVQREIEAARILDSLVPDKIWVKQQFSIGVNDVTRVLERMPTVVAAVDSSDSIIGSGNIKNVRLQAILLASDCYPQMLTKHLPSLASLKNVPLIYVKDKRRGSLRLGDLVKLKTAIAVGIKDRGNGINHLIKNMLNDQESQSPEALDALKASNMDMLAVTEKGPPEML
ncbi:50S ribosomal protein like [Heracleum sosnowskyi]|uniref:50S ribosomal protein like n=1 Tax=Heracleum sosnowskyi TaxID=360622 RepID=A0AAD8LZT5_9APIA|nr:50S ribosomal protein like [Heracleum sosnowskyi]